MGDWNRRQFHVNCDGITFTSSWVHCCFTQQTISLLLGGLNFSLPHPWQRRWKYLHHQWCRTCYQWGKLCLCITAPRCPWSAATQRFDEEGGMLQSADKTITAGAKLSLCCIEFHAVCMKLYIADKLSEGIFGWSTRFSKQCMSALSAHALLQCLNTV